MVDEEGLQALRAVLEADGYLIEVRQDGERLGAWISATPAACADCLVSKPLMRAMLHQALGVPEQSIDLRYPDER
jgi:hypothetical protein